MNSFAGKFNDLAACAPALRRQAESVAHGEAPLLVSGPEGAGKSCLAAALHHVSARRHEPLIVVDCSRLPGTLFFGEAFGHGAGGLVRGVGAALGSLRAAGAGTVVFENVDQLTSAALRDLVRAIAERHVTPLGTKERVPFAARVILTARRELPTEGLKAWAALDPAVACLLSDPSIAGALRAAGHLQLAGLAERADEIEPLIDRMLSEEIQRAEAGAERRVTLSPAAREWLRNYPWPRNLTEAQSLVERLVASGREQIGRVAVARILTPSSSPWSPEQFEVELTRFPGLASFRESRPGSCSRNMASRCRKS